MSTPIKKSDAKVPQWCDAILSLAKRVGAGSDFHLDKSESTVAAADATTLPTALVLVNQLRGVNQFHRRDAVAHKIADVATITAPAARTLAEAITLANELKADWATHIASTALHYTADATNTIAAADATDLATLLTLVNETKADMNAHMASGSAFPLPRAVEV